MNNQIKTDKSYNDLMVKSNVGSNLTSLVSLPKHQNN